MGCACRRHGSLPPLLRAWLTAIVLAFATPWLGGCEQPAPAIAELQGTTMGTTYSVKVYPTPAPDVLDRLQRRIEETLTRVNAEMSTYLSDSDLTRFNRNPSTDWQPVPAALAALVAQAGAISRATDGMYDVTIGPLVELWGFGSRGRRDTPPTDAEIAALLERVGYQRVEARLSPPALRKRVGGVAIDLSSIAKGWGVDELTRVLDAEGIASYLVEIGGELRARGDKGGQAPWRVAIERPLAGARAVQHLLALHDESIATSGDYRNFFEAGGQRYAHTIDPHSGHPVRHRLASVSVIAADCATADAWATALMALGDRRGPEVARHLHLDALFVVRDDDGLREMASDVWRAKRGDRAPTSEQ
ncbi:MAG: FAD:protein FMN transferase [Chromatiaceae bacterium]|nr:FAD:protein FMN transferase [Chromatiaceae bacterium]MCP5421900.1 FAD:protein FMN transferase [Chromatiaceae bacterium]